MTKTESDSDNTSLTYSIEYILNEKKNNIYYGLCDKINIPRLNKYNIYLDIEKILGKNNLRNIQGIRLKQEDLLDEISRINKINKLLILLICIILFVSIIGILK
jgi:hypothetical protein